MQSIEEIKNIHLQAFGENEGKEIEALVGALLHLKDTISLNIERNNKKVANIIFTPFYFEDFKSIKCYLLAPLAVLPEFQGQGIGKELIYKGIEKLKSMQVSAIFVLGDPAFYGKFGFIMANIQTPYPEVLTMPEGWQMLALNVNSMDNIQGKTRAVDEFMLKDMWDTSAYSE